MKKVFFVALLLISVFLIGNAEAQDECKLFLVTVTTEPDDALIPSPGRWQECVEVCFDGDGFAHAVTDCGAFADDYLYCTLEDLGLDTKNLVCYSDVFPKFCHAQVKRNILEADCVYTPSSPDTKIHVRGHHVNECCVNSCCFSDAR